MTKVFADTSGWASFFVRGEPLHTQAKEAMQKWHTNRVQLITTNYVLAELVALFVSPLRVPRSQQISLIDSIRSASWVEIIHIDPTLDVEAWALLKSRKDKMWSLVDCTSFVVMKHASIFEAFTTDHHFEQAGFTRILK